jgi:hypothetical protein
MVSNGKNTTKTIIEALKNKASGTALLKDFVKALSLSNTSRYFS